jgi:hypothetical protein
MTVNWFAGFLSIVHLEWEKISLVTKTGIVEMGVETQMLMTALRSTWLRAGWCCQAKD